jgi:hypothetical protein
MRILLLAMAVAISMVGCGGSSGGNNNTDLAEASNADLTQAGLPFGAACTQPTDCASNYCFIGGMMSFCTMPCTAATQATDCPNPPTSGTCNMKGYCKP